MWMVEVWSLIRTPLYIGMKNRVVDRYENTIFVHPVHICRLHIIPWIRVTNPDTWLAPLHQFRFPVKAFYGDPLLTPQPFFKGREELDSSTYIVENGVFGVVRFHTLVA